LARLSRTRIGRRPHSVSEVKRRDRGGQVARVSLAAHRGTLAPLALPQPPTACLRFGRVGTERVALAVASFGSPKTLHISLLPSPNRTCALCGHRMFPLAETCFHYQKQLSDKGKFQLSILGNFCLLAHSQEIR